MAAVILTLGPGAPRHRWMGQKKNQAVSNSHDRRVAWRCGGGTCGRQQGELRRLQVVSDGEIRQRARRKTKKIGGAAQIFLSHS